MMQTAAKIKRRNRLMAIVSVFIIAMAAGASAQTALPSHIRQIESSTVRIQAEITALDKERIQLLAKLRSLSGAIEQIKSKPDPSFLERRRLERLLGESQQAGEKLEFIVGRMNEKKELYLQYRQRTYDAYSEEMVRSADRLSGEKNRRMIIAFTRYFLQLRDRREKYRPPDTQFDKVDFLSVEIRPGESRASLKSKLDLLVKRRSRLSGTIRAIQKEIKALKKDLALSKQIKSLIDENNLFEEEVIFEREPGGIKTPEGLDGIDATGGTEANVDPATRSAGTGVGEGAFDSSGYSIEVEINRLESLLEYLSKVKDKLDSQIALIKAAMKNAPTSDRKRPGRAHSASLKSQGGRP